MMILMKSNQLDRIHEYDEKSLIWFTIMKLIYFHQFD